MVDDLRVTLEHDKTPFPLAFRHTVACVDS